MAQSTYFNLNKTTSSTAGSQQQTKPKINLFDFKTTQSVQPTSFSQFVKNKTSTPQNIMNFGSGVSQKGVTNVNEYNPATKKTENIFTPKPTTTQQSSGFSLIPTANADNGKMSLQEFGEMIKTKYPDYKNIDSIELGKKMLDKYPIYSNKVEINAEKTQPEAPQEEQGFFESIKYKPYSQEELTSYDPNKTTTQNILEGQGKYAKNIAGGLYNIVPGIAEMGTNLVTGTAKDVGMKVGNLFGLVSDEDRKAYDKAMSDKTGQIVGGVAKDYATKYGSVEGFKNAVMEDPTAIVGDALSVVGVGIAGKSKLTNIQKSALETQKSNIINQVKNATTLEEKSNLIKQGIEASKQIAEKTKQVKTLEEAQGIVNKYNPYIQAPILATKGVIKGGQMLKKTGEVVASPLNPVINQAKTLISKPNEIQGIQQAIKPYVKVRDGKVVRSDNQIKSEIQTANNYVNNSGIQQTSLATYRQALEKSLKGLGSEISARTKQPLEIDLSDTAGKLRELASKKTVGVLDKGGQQQILNIADDLEKGKLSVEEAEFMNQYINDELGNIPSASESLKRAKQILVQDIRFKLDTTLSNIPGEFKQLKKDYGALRNVLGDTIKREIVYNRQNPEGLITSISKIEGLSDVGTGLIKTITGSPKEGLTQVGQGILKNKVGAYIKTKNNPNEIIKNIFSNKSKNGNNINTNIPSTSKNSTGIKGDKQENKIKPILSDREKLLINKPKNAIPNTTTIKPKKTGREVLKTKVDENFKLREEQILEEERNKFLNFIDRQKEGKKEFKSVGNIIKDNPKYQGLLKQAEDKKVKNEKAIMTIYGELEGSKAGERVFLGSGADKEVLGVSSTFPKYLPEKSRTTPIVTRIIKHLNDGDIPNPKNVNVYEGYQAVIKRFESLGGDTKIFLKKLIPSNFKEKAQDLVDKTMEKIGGKMNIMGNEGIGADKTALLKGSDDLISEARKFKTFEDFIGNTKKPSVPLIDIINNNKKLFEDKINVDGTITIYRGTGNTKKDLKPGDYVTLYKNYAEGFSNGDNVIKENIPIDNLRFSTNIRSQSNGELFYQPQAQLKQIYEQSKPKLLKKTEPKGSNFNINDIDFGDRKGFHTGGDETRGGLYGFTGEPILYKGAEVGGISIRNRLPKRTQHGFKPMQFGESGKGVFIENIFVNTPGKGMGREIINKLFQDTDIIELVATDESKGFWKKIGGKVIGGHKIPSIWGGEWLMRIKKEDFNKILSTSNNQAQKPKLLKKTSKN